MLTAINFIGAAIYQRSVLSRSIYRRSHLFHYILFYTYIPIFGNPLKQFV